MLARWPAPASCASSRIRNRFGKLMRKLGRRDRVLVADQDQRRHLDRRDPVALVGEPHRFGADAECVGVDPRHRLGAPRRAVPPTRPRPAAPACALGQLAHRQGPLAAIERSWIAWPSGWTAKLSARISEAQRSRRRMMHRDRDHPAERQAADVRAVDAQRVHRRQDRRGEIVARGAGRGPGRFRHSPDNRTRPRAACRRNARAAAPRPTCPSRRRGGTGSATAVTRRPPGLLDADRRSRLRLSSPAPSLP